MLSASGVSHPFAVILLGVWCSRTSTDSILRDDKLIGALGVSGVKSTEDGIIATARGGGVEGPRPNVARPLASCYSERSPILAANRSYRWNTSMVRPSSLVFR